MPNRILRDWTDSDKVNQLSTEAEVFFVRLIMKADDFGRFHAEVKRLKAACFPLKDSIRGTDISRWLQECGAAGLIRCYDANGGRFLCIPKFDQRLRLKKERFPAPPEMTDECPSIDGHTPIPFVSVSDSTSDSDSDSDSLRDAACFYCGATEAQTGWNHEEDHVHPRCLGGDSSDENLVLACHPCNAAKQGRKFDTKDDCKAWLQWRFWSSSRARYVEHRKVAFGGNPPDPETVRRGIELHATTAAQPQNSKVFGTNPRSRKGFPVTPDDAIAQCGLQMNTRDWILHCFDKAASRGGRDAKDCEIKDFPAYVRTQWKYEQDRIGRERANGGSRTNQPSDVKPDYTKGF